MSDSAILQERLRKLRGAALPTRFPADAIYWRAETGSTNDDCRTMTESSPGRGVVVLADRQTAGRGQFGRMWEAPPGLGVLMSFSVLDPPPNGALLTAWASAATARMLDREFGLAAAVKWPNDVLVNRRKIAGVLVEVRGFPVVGIGLNVLQQREHFPPDCRLPPTSILLETNQPADRPAVAAALLHELESLAAPSLVEARDQIVAAWRARLDMQPGDRVSATLRDGALVGQLIDIHPTAGLRLRTIDGVKRLPAAHLLRVERTTGDVHLSKEETPIPNDAKQFALCIAAGPGEDLKPGKRYRVLSDVSATEVDCLRVIDESGEDFLYPARRFILFGPAE